MTSDYVEQAEVVGREWMMDEQKFNTVVFVPRRHGATTMLRRLLKENETDFMLQKCGNHETLVYKKTGIFFSVLTPHPEMDTLIKEAHKIELICINEHCVCLQVQ